MELYDESRNRKKCDAQIASWVVNLVLSKHVTDLETMRGRCSLLIAVQVKVPESWAAWVPWSRYTNHKAAINEGNKLNTHNPILSSPLLLSHLHGTSLCSLSSFYVDSPPCTLSLLVSLGFVSGLLCDHVFKAWYTVGKNC